MAVEPSRKDYEPDGRGVPEGRVEEETFSCAGCVVGESSRKDYELQGGSVRWRLPRRASGGGLKATLQN